MLSFSETQKGNRVCSFLGYEYRLVNHIDGIDVYRCREDKQSKCRASLKIRGETICPGYPTDHTHHSAHQMTEVREV